MTPQNLFTDIPDELPDELVEVLAAGRGSVRIERIVSRGHASAPGFWYDQPGPEWVALLSGSARLEFEGRGKGDGTDGVELRPGDWLEIPAHCRHRVAATAGGEDSVWLAVHWEQASAAESAAGQLK